ncbi:MAG: phage portal protein [Hyphomicrobiaceae bacterium]
MATFGITGTAGVHGTGALHQPAVAAAVRLISESVASLDIGLFERGPDGSVEEHPALDLLRGQANPWTSGYELTRDLVAAALTYDAGGLAFVNRVGGEVREIVHYDPGQIAVAYAVTREPTYTLGSENLSADAVLHLRGPFSKSPTTLAREAITAAAAMERHAVRLFQNGARPGGVIEFPKALGDEALKKVRAAWRAAHEGAENTGRTAILWDGAKFVAATFNSVDAQFEQLRRFQLEEICRVFGLSPSMIGDLTKSSYANAEQKSKEFLSYTLEPWLRALEAAFNRALLNEDERSELTFRFDRDDLTRASLTERATAISSLISSRTISPNEGRDWLGLPQRDGGNEFANPNTGASQPGAGDTA